MATQNSNVTLRKKVTLRQKQSVPEPTPAPKPKKWLWAIVAAVVVAGGALMVANLGKDKSQEQVAKVDAPLDRAKDAATKATDVALSDEDAVPTMAAEENPEVGAPANEDPAVASPSAQEAPVSKASAAPAEKKEAPSVAATVSDKPATSSKSSATREAVTSAATATLSSSLDENALRVVRGEFGNGQERKDALGNRYGEIQARVNEMYREGRFN